MKKYEVSLHEVEIVNYIIEAENEDEAIFKAKNGLYNAANRDFIGFNSDGEAIEITEAEND